MTRSLQWHVSINLGIAIVLSGLIAAITSFSLAYAEAKEFQDDMLLQIATLVAADAPQSRSPGSDGSAQRHNANVAATRDSGNLVRLIQLPNDPAPPWLAGDLLPGFHTVRTEEEAQIRLFVRDTASGQKAVVAQSTEPRNEIAIQSALHALIPLLIACPILAWIFMHILRRDLAPISRLARTLDQQPADRPEGIPVAGLPREITPFVHAINRLLLRVNDLMAQQRRFIADAAHELRGPLTALAVQAENLRQVNSLQGVSERLIPLRAGIERARQLTEQLLSLARTRAAIAEAKDVNVSEMARELIADCFSFAESKQIDLGLEETEPLSLRASPELLRSILRNGLENALKHSPSGSVVTVRLVSNADLAVIEVVDNGPGIPIVERERVFDSFYRMAGAAGDGSGLGLSIAREAALRLGGSVSLHERPDGTGLVFRYEQRRRP